MVCTVLFSVITVRRGVNEEDRSPAAKALKEYGNLRMDTDVMRCKALCHFAAGLYYIGYGRRGGKAGWRYADDASSRQGGAVACTCPWLHFYGCTDSSIYYHLAHEAIDPWKKEGKFRKRISSS